MNKIFISIIFYTMVAGLFVIPDISAVGNDWNVKVNIGGNCQFTYITGNFENMRAGDIGILNSTFNIANTGNIQATVTATFTTHIENIYGLTNTSYIIPGTAFYLRPWGGNWTQLRSDGSEQDLIDKQEATTQSNYDAKIIMPSGQEVASYIGTIEITCS